MEDVDDEKKGLGNSGRGKDISTIIEAGQEGEADENNDADEPQKDVKPKPSGKQMGDDSEDSDEIKRPKKTKGKKRARKLNNLEVSSEDDARDEDFKIKESSSDSDEAYSMSSVSESSLEYARGRKKQDRSSTRTRRKRFESKFIDDNSSDDEPLVQTVKRKKNKSDSEEFDVDDEDSDGESNENEDIDSDDLCDDSETESSEGNWPKKKKRAPASYDKRPAKKKVKRTEDEDKAFRAGISTKKLLKDQVEKAEDNKDSSESEDETKRRKTRGKKLLYLMEDDLESSDDGIKPGVKRPDTPPEEREMFIKKQEEIKRMLAAKNTEAAKQLAAPNIEPIQIMLNKPPPPPVLPGGPISDSLSTIPKQVIESARALDTDYLRKAPISAGMELPDDFNPEDMNEEELAKMMEEEDFAQHQLKLAGEAIARTKKIKEQEGKKDGAEKPKRGRKSKADKALEAISAQPPSVAPTTVVAQSAIIPISMPQHPADVQMSRPSAIASLQTFTNHPQHPPSKLIQQLQTTLSAPPTSMMPLGAIPNQPPPQLLQHHHHMRPSMPPQGPNMMPVGPGMYGPGMYPRPSHMGQPPMERRGPSIFHDAQQQPSMLPTTLMNVHPSQMHHQQPIPQIVPQQESPESKKRGRRKKFTPLRTDLPNDPNDPQQSPSKSAEFGSPNSTSSTPERSDPKVSGNFDKT